MTKTSGYSAGIPPYRLLAGLFILTVLFAVPAPAAAQHFGRNKVQYDKFDFKILATEHFDMYYYPAEAAAAAEAGRMAERWYGRLSRLLGHQLSSRQAVVLYASHPDFEQTNVIEGQLDEGTGGVTESARRRVVMPLAATLADSDHVLGHELVHAFQYDMLGRNIEGLPLWFVEGMAEYLSLGPRDTQTAMWLRDAAIEGRLPKLDSLGDPRYFPYRFGHAIWAYVGGRRGDMVIGEIMRGLAPVEGPGQAGPSDAVAILESALGEKREVITEAWHGAIREAYGIAKPTPSPKTPPTDYAVIGQRTGYGTLNVGPALSPDGKRVAFLSARDLLSIDMYVADAQTGRDARKIIRTAGDPHFDSLQFLGSAGAWAPDGKRLAVATVRKGQPAIAIVDADRADVTEEFPLPDLGEIFQPSWSPDGKAVAFSAQVGGVTDLYVFDLATKQAKRLTNDASGDLQPSWSPDGTRLVFVTDRYRGNLAQLQFAGTSLAMIDIATGAVTPVDNGLTSGRVLDPKFTPDGKSLYFISDARGTPQVYRVSLATNQPEQITDVETGIAGVTPTSPALSMAANGSRFAVSLFVNGGYEIQFLDPARLNVAEARTDGRDLGLLPPKRTDSAVATELAAAARDLPAAATFTEEPFKNRFGLTGVAQQIGVATSGAYGTYVSGGIAFQFSDILGNHILNTVFDVNGGVRDIGASASYLNRTHRWNWGVFGEHAPLLSGSVAAGLTQVNGQTVYVEQTQLFRQTYTQAGALLSYPLSRTARVEVGSAVSHIGFTREVHSSYFDLNGNFLGDESEDLPAGEPLRLFDVRTAFVRDTASFGAVSPVLGQRFRAEIAPTNGDLKMTNVTLDFRQYLMPVRPVTFAFRGLHVGRYGGSAEDERLLPLFVGYPSLVRGYDPNSFQVSECTLTVLGSCQEFDQMSGSRIGVFNAEVRIPAFGFKNRQMNYGPIPIELFGFFDSGIAWNSFEDPAFAGGSRDFVSSAGFGARVSALGFLIAELNMARPLNRNGRGWMFVFNLRPGF